MNASAPAGRVLMCPPQYFGVDYVINPWMSGNVHRTSPREAATQWNALRSILARHAAIQEIAPRPECPDMVFTANAGLVIGDLAVPSRFMHSERRGEEPHFARWFESNGFNVQSLPEDVPFEGAGDALLDREHPWLWAAYGFRTELQAHAYLQNIFDVEVLSLRLVDARFYHLDTCFCPLQGGFLLYFPPAFDTASLAAIESRIPDDKRLAVGETDALNFACNAVNLGSAVILNRATEPLQAWLRERGFTVIETPLDEFMKAGGAAKCLTLRLDESPGKSAEASPAVGTEPLPQRMLEFSGHLLDSGTLSRALDTVIDAGGSFQIRDFSLGEQRHSPSYARVLITAPTGRALEEITLQLLNLGGRLETETATEAQLETVTQDGVAPEDFYVTTIYPTEVYVSGRWRLVQGQRMDAMVVVRRDENGISARCKLLRDLTVGDRIVVGVEGIRTRRGGLSGEPGGKTRPADEFGFMGAGISSERRVELAVENIAWELRRLRDQGAKTVVVAGPVVIHTGGGPHLERLIREGYVGALLAGNALAVHDIECALFGTALGVDLGRGIAVQGGHRNHLRAINRIRACGGIRQAVEQGVLMSGIFYECVRAGVPFSLAGSIRDDGPLPDTQMDLIRAQEEYARLLEGSRLTLLLSSMLHSIGVGNMTPAGVKLVCVDINPAVVTKLSDRGSLESTGIVTDVGLFLSLLTRRLEKGAEAS